MIACRAAHCRLIVELGKESCIVLNSSIRMNENVLVSIVDLWGSIDELGDLYKTIAYSIVHRRLTLVIELMFVMAQC